MQPRQLLGTESSKPEIAELNVVAPLMLEDFDSDYEIFSLRNDATFCAKDSDVESVSKEKHLGVDNVVTQRCDNRTSFQSPKIASAKVTSSDKPSDPTRPGEMPQKETLFVDSSINGLGRNRTKQSMKRKMDPADEETALDMRDLSQKRTNSVGLGSSVQVKTESEDMRVDVSHVRKRMHDQPSPAYKVEANHCCLDMPEDENTRDYDAKSGLSYSEVQSGSGRSEIKSKSRMQVGSSTGSLEKSICDGHHGQWANNLQSRVALACMTDLSGLKRNLLQTYEKENGGEFEVRSMNSAEVPSAGIVSVTNTDSQRRTRCSMAAEPGLPYNDLSNAEYVEYGQGRGHSDCGNTFVSPDRADSDLHVSCSGKDRNSAQVAVLCGSCSYPFTNYAEVAYETFNKSYLTTLYSGEIQSIRIPMILIEYHNLHSLVKEKLSTSIPPASVPSDECRKNNLLHGGVWIREDGCVYEHIFCPHCEDQSICVGVHVAACDKMNLQLMDKVSLQTSPDQLIGSSIFITCIIPEGQ